MNRLIKFTLLAFVCCSTLITHSQNVVISSPDRKTTVVFKIDSQKDNAPFYSVKNQGRVILAESPLGFEFENQTPLKTKLRIVSTKRRNVNTVWKPIIISRELTGFQFDKDYTSSFSTPWRYVMIADSPGKLLENNYFILNLNAPKALTDVSWIKPGKVIREATLTTKGGNESIDFTAKGHLLYLYIKQEYRNTNQNLYIRFNNLLIL